MSASSIVLPDDVKQIADDRAAAAGYADASAYVQALILADAAEPISPTLEAHLLRALNDAPRKMTASDWDKKREELGRRLTGK